MKFSIIGILPRIRIFVMLIPLSLNANEHAAGANGVPYSHNHRSSLVARQRTIRSETRSYANDAGGTSNVLQIYSKQNTKVMLDCGVNINFSTSMWLKDGQIVQTIPRDKWNNKLFPGYRFSLDEHGSLFIENVRLDDDGRWQCEAEDAFGFAVSGNRIQLSILDEPKKVYLMIDNHILDPGNPFIPVQENADLTISCVVDDGNPKPTLSWELSLSPTASMQGMDMPETVQNFSEIVRDHTVGTQKDARISKVLRAHHNATFTCSVHHIALIHPLLASVLLNVQYTPSFAISREPGFGFPITEGIPVSLKCDVDSNPKALPIWKKDDTSPPIQQTSDGYLNFTNIRQEHSGWYKCVARHRLGLFSSIGYFLNVRADTRTTAGPDFGDGELNPTFRPMEVSLGGAVRLACPPDSSGCWAHVSPLDGHLEPLGAQQELKLDRIMYHEAGEYRCIAPPKDSQNRFERFRKVSTVEVSVTGRPIVVPTNDTITAVVAQPLTLTMEFCANPPYTKAFWLAKGRVYLPGEADQFIIAYKITNSTTIHCHQAVLFLTKVAAQDIGEYTFIVRSPNGLADGIFYVNLTYPDGYSQIHDAHSICAKQHQSCSVAIFVIVITLVIAVNGFYFH